MIESQILSQTDKYALSLLNPSLINFDMLVFDKELIYLPIITSQLSEITESLENENDIFINDAILCGNIFLTYDPISHVTEMLIAEHGAIQRGYDVASVMFIMKQYGHSDYAEYKLTYDKFNSFVKEELKKQIKEIMTEVKGEFITDFFKKDTYFQARMFNGQKIFYIIYRWWDKLCDGEVNFFEGTNGDGTVFISRND